jgi:SAM-dependent methyltransferase
MHVRHHWDLLWTEAQRTGAGALRGSDETLRRDALGWDRPLDAADLTLVGRIDGPVVDVGCGPGRFAAEFRRLGVRALGLDVSPAVVQLARRRGASAVAQCVFDPVPGEGAWEHVILPDGNIGIGGEPRRLLRRVADLVGPGGAVHIELDPPGSTAGRLILRLEPGPGHRTAAVPWARVTPSEFPALAAEVGLRVAETWNCHGRWFATTRTSIRTSAPRSRQ